MGEKPLTLEEAIQWCIDEQAVVSFINVYGHKRVRVRTGGYAFVERDTLLEAVGMLRYKVEVTRAARKQPQPLYT